MYSGGPTPPLRWVFMFCRGIPCGCPNTSTEYIHRRGRVCLPVYTRRIHPPNTYTVGAGSACPYTSPVYIPRIHPPNTSTKNIHMQLRNKPHANHSRFPQMSDDGLHLMDEIIFASGIAIHGLQFLLEHGTSLYPSVEVLHGTLRLAVRAIEHGKF